MYHTNINNIIDSIQKLYAIEVIQIIEYFPCAHSLCSQTWLFKPNMSSMRHSVDIFTTQSLCRRKLNSILREIDVKSRELFLGGQSSEILRQFHVK